MKAIIVITEPFWWKGEVEAIRVLLQLGITYLHVRKPQATESEMRNFLSLFSTDERERMVLHDFFDLAHECGCGGIHHNSRNQTIPSGWEGRLSRSCHNFLELKSYKSAYDYLFLSPIFDSISKQGYSRAFTTDELAKACQEGIIDETVYALGGITKERLVEVFSWGFGGAVFLGDIWSRMDTPYIVSYVQSVIKTAQLAAIPAILSIAGSDPSSGAGVQADLKTISSIGGYGLTAITALTIQNTQRVERFIPISKNDLLDQIRVVSEDFSVKGVKIGMLPTLDSVEAVVEALQKYSFPYVVYDPIMVSSTGQNLMNIEVRREIIQTLSPLLDLITPNIHEAEWILSKNISSVEDMISSSQELEQQLGCAVLLKGGHLDSADMIDVLCDKGEVHLFSHPKILSSNLHGTGCTLSSAIATYLALGNNLPEAVRLAKEYLSSCIQNSHIMQLGKGCGPMWHF